MFFLVMLNSPQAEEIRYPVPCYQGEELEKIRQWEKEWVGKKIDTTNIDLVREFVPESLYQIFKDPETWGESWFDIAPYREIKPSQGDLKFTQKYEGTCSISSDNKLLNYISGIPFPHPKTALEMAYNIESVNHGDHRRAIQDIVIIDGKSHYDRRMVMDSRFLYFSGRREIPPLPEILPNERKIFSTMHAEYHKPASMKGTRILSIKWIDRTRDSESWSWSSTTRKLVRKSTAQRQSTQGGSDSSSDDTQTYNSAISFMNYKYLGRKELVLARHQDIDQIKNGHQEGYCLFNGFIRERVKTYVVECIHKNPNYLYSKQIWYVDPETWWILYADKFDRQAKLWRVFDNPEYVAKSLYNGAIFGAIGFILIVDVQRLHSTGAFSNFKFGETGKLYQPDYYTAKALQKYGY